MYRNAKFVYGTVAIAIVADTLDISSLLHYLSPLAYFYLFCIYLYPAILHEYQTAELNVHMGCLKVQTFMFECIRPQSAYYVDSVITMLEDILMDGDLVHC